MKRIISLIFIGFLLSSCSHLRTHKMDIEQGNIISQEEVAKLHRGMTEGEVKNILGTPMLINIFTPNRTDYVYTFKSGYGNMLETRVTCHFIHGRLQEIIRS